MKRNPGMSPATTCIRIGHGEAGRIHEAIWQRLGVETLAVVEPLADRREELQRQGLKALGDIGEALCLQPDFFDICAPTANHLDALEAIGSAYPRANILVEKPICQELELDRLLRITSNFEGRIVVNEHYVSSAVLEVLKSQVAQLDLTVDRVVVESTKHRGADFLEGRFRDETLGVLGYEGPHLIATAEELGHKIDFSRVLDVDIDAIDLPGRSADTGKMLRQGGGCIQYLSKQDAVVDLYTSMSGIVGFPCPPIATPTMRIAHGDHLTKYRHIRLHGWDPQGTPYQLAGFLDPVVGAPRTAGAVVIFRNWCQEGPIRWIRDDTMMRHFERVLSHFQAAGLNPYSVSRAVDDVRALAQWARQGWDLVNDSDNELGDHEKVMRRQEEALRFRGAKA